MNNRLVIDDALAQELQQVDDEFIRFISSAWNKLEDDVITSLKDKPEFNTITARYFRDHLQDVLRAKESYDSYADLWLHLLAIRLPKTDFYKQLPPRGRASYFGTAPLRFNPAIVDQKLLFKPKIVASALMYAVEAAHGSADISQYPINVLLLLDLIQNDKHNARKVLRQIGLTSSEADRLIEAGSSSGFIRDNVIAVLSEFSGGNAVYDTVFKKALDKLKTSNVKLLFGTIDNDRLVKKGAAMRKRSIKIGQTAASSAQSTQKPSASELAVSYSSFWPVLLSLAGLSALGLYAYYNWFGKDEENKEESVVDLTGENTSSKDNNRRIVIKL